MFLCLYLAFHLQVFVVRLFVCGWNSPYLFSFSVLVGLPFLRRVVAECLLYDYDLIN